VFWIRKPARVEDKPLLAVIPLSAPRGDPEAAHIAQILAHSLEKELYSPELSILPSFSLTAIARREGVSIDGLSSTEGPDVARAAGADLLIRGQLVPVGGHYDVHCELLMTNGMEFVASADLEGVTTGNVRRSLDALAIKLRGALGLSADQADVSRLSRDPATLRSYADGLDAMDRGDFHAACRHLADTIERDPDFALAHYYHARALGWRDSGRASQEAAEYALCFSRQTSFNSSNDYGDNNRQEKNRQHHLSCFGINRQGRKQSTHSHKTYCSQKCDSNELERKNGQIEKESEDK